MAKRKQRRITKRGAAMVMSFIVLSLLAVAATSYIDSSTETIRTSKRITAEVVTTNLSDSGVQAVLRDLWRPFKISQSFQDFDADLTGASTTNAQNAVTGTVPGVGTYSAGVIRYETVSGNPYVRLVTIRSVGFVDSNNNGAMDANEPNKTVDVTARFELARSDVFDYTYFINNYGWMDGFKETDLIVNGDMRSNGNFDFLNGSPTVNGSVYASVNDKLSPRAVGLINTAPVKMSQTAYSSWSPPSLKKLSGESNSDYAARNNAYQAMLLARRRQSYSSVTHGADGSTAYDAARDFVFRSEAALVGNRTAGAILADSQGIRSWTKTASNQQATLSMLDTNSTRETIMPDLSDISDYQALSSSYVDNKATYSDGTSNPYAGQGAWVEVWNSSTNSYQRLSTNGNISGSAVLVGTDSKPIKIHGPVTVSQDVVIKGTIQGQGTLYAGRNVHIVGSIKYASGPDFQGGSDAGINASNEKKDMLGLAARGSVVMGNPNSFGSTYPLAYMTPANPPSKPMGTYGRYDENGVWIPAYNAYDVDSSGKQKYKSVISDSVMNSIAEGVNRIDAVLYSNFVGGGNVGTDGSGIVINGTIISRDEAIVTWSLPLIMNYDNRIREREISNQPLIDLELPRSPVLYRSTWQDRGFYYQSGSGYSHTHEHSDNGHND